MQNSSIVSETSNMAEPINLLFLYLISTLLVLKMVQQCHQVVAKPGGFTIELIHRNSPDSPFYQPNLTYAQRIQTLAHQSITRAQYLKNITALTLASKFSPETARFLINPIQGFALYSIKLGIGTIPTSSQQHKMYNLLVDTGSDLTWVQCEYCKQHNCFQVTDEPFPSTSSTSYKLLPCKAHPLCEGPCIDGSCSFERGYTDESYVNGFLASETFSFDSSSGPAREFVQGLVFGCTIDSNKISFAGDDNEISGVMGLGFGPKAFVNQLNSPQGQSNGRFSYCLRRERIAWPTNSFIKFGSDVQQRPDLSVTALRKFNNLVHYYINLVGISVNSNKVNIPDAEFAVRPDGTGGSIIDSGASFTHLRRSVHDAVVGALDAVFAGYGGAVKKVPKVGDAPFELCYEVLNEQEFRGYPVITFHLDNNANLVLDFQSAYLIGKGGSGNVQFYFAVIPDDDPKGVNSIGAYQQTNYRFIYDTKEFKLFFGPENCFHST